MTNNSNREDARFLLLRDCSDMDSSLVERLRATVEVSLEWAEQVLDVLIRMDTDLQAFDTTIKQQMSSPQIPEDLSSGEPEDRVLDFTDITHQTEQNVQRLRNGIRDVMMSMQHQDVIGQAIERAASAVEKRAAALERVVEGLQRRSLPTEIPT